MSLFRISNRFVIGPAAFNDDDFWVRFQQGRQAHPVLGTGFLYRSQHMASTLPLPPREQLCKDHTVINKNNSRRGCVIAHEPDHRSRTVMINNSSRRGCVIVSHTSSHHTWADIWTQIFSSSTSAPERDFFSNKTPPWALTTTGLLFQVAVHEHQLGLTGHALLYYKHQQTWGATETHLCF